MDRFDVAVIGRGMVGAAAARHLVEAGSDVAVVGPDEPSDRRSSEGPFCSHPDEGRITRIAGRSRVWSVLAARSIARYDDIAARSGIEFHEGRGLVASLPTAPVWVQNGERAGGPARLVEPEWVTRTTGIAVSDQHPVLYEGAPAGLVNPRRLVAAQTRLCELGGATVVREAVVALRPDRGGVRVETSSGGVIAATRALVSTGAFGAELLPVELQLSRMPRTTVTAEIVDDGRLPSLILRDPPDARLEGIYWVPPVRYPDGRVALKIGGDLRGGTPIEPSELTAWYRSDGDPVEVAALQECVHGLLPGVAVHSWAHKPCVVSETPSDHPYIGWVDDRVAVALGGNGAAAKSSDEIGRLAATLFGEQGWTDSISLDTFTPLPT